MERPTGLPSVANKEIPVRRYACFAVLGMSFVLGSSPTHAGLNLLWWKKKETCEQPCHGPQYYGPYNGAYCYYPESQPKEKKEKNHCSCCKGEYAELAPIVSSVAANFRNQQAVPIERDDPSPIKMKVQPDSEPDSDSEMDEADTPSDPSLVKRIGELEDDMKLTSQMLVEISKQLEALK